MINTQPLYRLLTACWDNDRYTREWSLKWNEVLGLDLADRDTLVAFIPALMRQPGVAAVRIDRINAEGYRIESAQ